MRKAQGLSLRDVAQAATDRGTPLSASYLSQVERGLREPSQHWLNSVKRVLADDLIAKSA